MPAAATGPLPAGVPSPQRPAPRGLPLPLAAAVLGAASVLIAAAAATGLVLLLNTAAAWAAALSAAVGALVAGVPALVLLVKLSRTLPSNDVIANPDAALSGVPRALFIDLAEREFARARRYGSGAALLLVDVDRHAGLCEARGTGAGDAVLAAVLQQTAPTLRPADLLTRVSDTQVAIFLAHADATGALDVAERIRERTEQLEVAYAHERTAAATAQAQAHEHAQAQALRITVSVGVAHLRAAHLNLRALLDDADDAVVAARQAGGNCVRAAPVDSLRARTADGWRDDRRAKPKPERPS